MTRQAPRDRHEPLYDIIPRTGVAIEVFFSDRTMETFGRVGAGWFWWRRRRGFAPEGERTGPFATSYAAYRHAMTAPVLRHAVGLQ
ncbi:MAG TPA: hypothetical protein VGN42_06190 [Pirellulales bacterium]|jgi:hypothetical protein|nr:hypothetical protein [Pirellulales bacterium]